MNLRRFLDAAYAMYVDELMRLGMNLAEATEKTVAWAAHTIEHAVDPVDAEVARQNQSALDDLEKMMQGVQAR